MGTSRYRELMRSLKGSFSFFAPDSTVHPVDVLTSANSPYLLCLNSLTFRFRQIIKPLYGRKRIKPVELAVQLVTLAKLP